MKNRSIENCCQMLMDLKLATISEELMEPKKKKKMKVHNLTTQDCSWAESSGPVKEVPGMAIYAEPTSCFETMQLDGTLVTAQHIAFVPFGPAKKMPKPKGEGWEKFEVDEGQLKGYIGYFRSIGFTAAKPETH